jgi:hypothetical protein
MTGKERFSALLDYTKKKSPPKRPEDFNMMDFRTCMLTDMHKVFPDEWEFNQLKYPFPRRKNGPKVVTLAAKQTFKEVAEFFERDLLIWDGDDLHHIFANQLLYEEQLALMEKFLTLYDIKD